MVYRDGKKVGSEDSPPEPGAMSGAKDGNDGSETALIPKSLLEGMDVKPGDEIRLKVVNSYQDELEVEYAHAEESDDQSKEAPQPMGADMMQADA